MFKSTPVHRRRKERVERSPSLPRYIIRPRAPTPPPRLYSPPLLGAMPPKQNPAPKPFEPLPKVLPLKKEDVKASDKAKDKAKDRPRVKIYERGHKHSNSYDTGYASAFSSPSPFSVEERSPLDYTTVVPKSPKPRPDREAYEIITGSNKPKYVRFGSDRSKDASPTAERKRDIRYVSRTPDSPGVEDEYVPASTTEARQNRFAAPRKSTLVLQREISRDPETTARTYEATRAQDARLEQLQTELQKLKLKRQIAEGRTAEAERKLEQQRLDDLERREREFQKQKADEQRKREEREADLADRQWKEIQTAPGAPNPPLRRSSTLVEQAPPSRRHTLMAPYSSTAVTSIQSPSVLDTNNPFLAPILEAQREEDARRRQAREERRSNTTVKETGRTARPRARKDDRWL